MEEIRELWNTFETTPMPFGHRSISVEGASLTVLQSDIGACIIAYLVGGGKLSSPRKDILKSSTKKLASAFEQCTQDGRAHFEKLVKISAMVLKSLN